MEKAEIKSRYEKMVKTIETANMYDGRGTYDLYECEKCGCKKFTTYKDKGVTPFMLTCPNCKNGMHHTYTFRNVPEETEVDPFVRPSLDIAYKLNDAQIDHLFNGGLFLESDLPKIDDNLQKLDDTIVFYPVLRCWEGTFGTFRIRIAPVYTPEQIARQDCERTCDLCDLEHWCRHAKEFGRFMPCDKYDNKVYFETYRKDEEMGRFVSKQPNGKYCVFSSIVDTVIAEDMTAQEYIEFCKEEAAEQARYALEHYLKHFSKVKEQFLPSNQTVDEFNEWLKKVGDKEPLDKSLYEHHEEEDEE